MNKAKSLTLLKEKLNYALSDIDSLKLVEALCHIPLAITQAAAYILQIALRMNVTKYLNLFLENEVNQSSLLLGRDKGDLRRDLDVPNTVITTWQISFD